MKTEIVRFARVPEMVENGYVMHGNPFVMDGIVQQCVVKNDKGEVLLPAEDIKTILQPLMTDREMSACFDHVIDNGIGTQQLHDSLVLADAADDIDEIDRLLATLPRNTHTYTLALHLLNAVTETGEGDD